MKKLFSHFRHPGFPPAAGGLTLISPAPAPTVLASDTEIEAVSVGWSATVPMTEGTASLRFFA